MIYKYKDYETPYDIDINGQVRNVKTNRYLKGHLNKKTGYKSVYLYLPGGDRVRVNIHSMVMSVFNPCTNEGLVIDHINEDKTDNRLSNLRWITPRENVQRSAYRHSNVKPVYQYSLDGVLIEEHRSLGEAARANNINRSWLNAMLLKYGNFAKSNNYLWSYNKI